MTANIPDRATAIGWLGEKISDQYLKKHSLATEAIMRALARKLGENEELWGITGLLHDWDLEEVKNDMSVHGNVTAQWLQEMGFPAEGIKAVRSHNEEGIGVPRESKFDFALSAAEQITGLIFATSLVMPNKTLAEVKASSVVKRMKDKRFAAKVNRDRIRECEKLGLELTEFAAVAVSAMQAAAHDLEEPRQA